MRRHPFVWCALAGAVTTAALLGCAVVALFRVGWTSVEFGWRPRLDASGSVVVWVDPSGPAAGQLRKGDRPLALDGDPLIRYYGRPAMAIASLPGQYTVRLERAGRELEVSPRKLLLRRSQDILGRVALLFTAMLFLLGATAAGLAKPEAHTVRLAYAGSLVLAGHLAGQAAGAARYQLAALGPEMTGLLVLSSLFPLHLAFGYDFFSRFPTCPPESSVWRVLRIVLYVSCVFAVALQLPVNGFFPASATTYRSFLDAGRDWIPRLQRVRELVLDPVQITGIPLVGLVLVRNYRFTQDPGGKRRLRWIVLSVVVVVVPMTLNLIVGFVFYPYSQSGAYRLISTASNSMAAVIPVAIWYAILKHQVIDIRIVIRRGVRYVLAKRVLEAIFLLPVIGFIVVLLSHPNRTLAQLLVEGPAGVYLLLIAGLALSIRYRRPLRLALDRRFFREAYDQEKVLLELIETIKTADSVPEISRYACEELDRALHTSRAMLFYRSSGQSELSAGYSSSGTSSPHRIPEDFHLLTILHGRRTALDFPLRRDVLPAAESEVLAALGAALIVPILDSNGRLLGLLLLGEKRSEEPYSNSDRNLLQTVAAQLAVVIENFWLREKVISEQRTRREVLAQLATQNILVLRECPQCGTCYDSTQTLCTADGAELAMNLPVERLIDGRYRLDRLLGRGGMGAVYLAHDIRLSRAVAAKIMIGSLFGNQNALRRFEREAQTSALISHPNVVRIYDFGRLGGDGAFLIMEYINGRSWRQLLKEGMMSPAQAAPWFDQFLIGLEAAHALSVVHRDLKPENLLISDGNLKILDFGLAKLRTGEVGSHESITMPGAILGTLRYMSPEQLSGDEVDARTDVFSVGIVPAESLTGRLPFQGRSLAGQLQAMMTQTFHLPGEDPRTIEVDRVLQRCIAKDRKDRFESVTALRAALIPALAACPPLAAARVTSDAIDTVSFGTPA